MEYNGHFIHCKIFSNLNYDETMLHNNKNKYLTVH